MRAFGTTAAALALLTCAACSSDDTKTTVKTAIAEIEPKTGNTTLAGTATFVEKGGKTTLTLQVTGAPPGEHGAHIHEKGDCSADDASSAGGHWNPATHDHGMPAPTSHLGDLGNLTVKADGTGSLTLEKTEWNIEGDPAGDVTEKAIIIHLNVDDFTTQPTGNAGGRIGCGVIQFDSEETVTTS